MDYGREWSNSHIIWIEFQQYVMHGGVAHNGDIHDIKWRKTGVVLTLQMLYSFLFVGTLVFLGWVSSFTGLDNKRIQPLNNITARPAGQRKSGGKEPPDLLSYQ